ncbi:MAG: hypothetical protein QM754_01625 [Tepidisphaeraceae bacterium]
MRKSLKFVAKFLLNVIAPVSTWDEQGQPSPRFGIGPTYPRW